jgi:hypothetical protein
MSDSSSEEITLDEQGRCIIGGSVDLTTRCFEHALPVVSDSLLADAAAAFTARAAGVGELSAGCTFWVPAATKKPKTSLEQLALDIFTFHARDAVFEPSKSGAEWWTLVIDESDEVGLHWDRDYDLQADQGLLLHPMVSTVTYLTTPCAAAPTVVLGRPSPLLASESPCGSVPSATACWPALGRHLAFDGKLLHGALPDLTPSPPPPPPPTGGAAPAAAAGRKRVTFLVNVWLNHVPWGAEKLPKSIAKQLSVAASGVRMGLGEAVPVPPQPVCSTLGDALPPLASWTFGEPRAKLTLSMPWPHAAVATLVDASRMATKGTRSAPPFLSITFGDGSGAELAPAQKLMKSEKKRMQKDGAADAERAARHDARRKRPKSKG